jgi:hypothetical protein
MVALARTYLFAPVLHYVDDFGAIEPQAMGFSGFHAIADFNKPMGLTMAAADKAAYRQRVLGTMLTIQDDHAMAAPTPGRVERT